MHNNHVGEKQIKKFVHEEYKDQSVKVIAQLCNIILFAWHNDVIRTTITEGTEEEIRISRVVKVKASAQQDGSAVRVICGVENSFRDLSE